MHHPYVQLCIIIFICFKFEAPTLKTFFINQAFSKIDRVHVTFDKFQLVKLLTILSPLYDSIHRLLCKKSFSCRDSFRLNILLQMTNLFHYDI